MSGVSVVHFMAYLMKWYRKAKAVVRYALRKRNDSEGVARGAALGLFIGFLPSIGFQIFLAFLLAGKLNANRLVALVGTAVTNPLTAVPISVFSIWLGDYLHPTISLPEISMQAVTRQSLLEHSGLFLQAYLIGCATLSITGGALGYVAIKVYYRLLQR